MATSGRWRTNCWKAGRVSVNSRQSLLALTVALRGPPSSRLNSPKTPPGPSVQIFGLASDQGTRAAIRFFKERRIAIHQVDLKRKPIAAGELRRFVERLGAAALLDTDGRAYRDAGLGYMRMGDAEIVERLLADPGLLRLPLVRFGTLAFLPHAIRDVWSVSAC